MSDNRLKGWREMLDAGIIENAGSARGYLTGSWRIKAPKIDMGKCVHCLLCWWYCPDSCILVDNSKVKGIDLDHCKGCGICAEVCPPKVCAIKMGKNEES